MILTSLENVKLWLCIDASETSEDALLTMLIRSKSAAIETILSRNILATDYVQSVDGFGSCYLTLKDYPINSVDYVKIDGQTISAEKFTFDSKRIILKDRVFPVGFGNVEVSYNAGFNEVPIDLEQACIELVAMAYKEKDRIGQNQKSILGGSESITFQDSQFNKSVMMILKKYKRVMTK